MLGLINTEVGVLGGQWGNNNTESDIELEWEVIQSDLSQNDEYLMYAEQLKELDTTPVLNNAEFYSYLLFMHLGW